MGRISVDAQRWLWAGVSRSRLENPAAVDTHVCKPEAKPASGMKSKEAVQYWGSFCVFVQHQRL